MAGEWQHSTLGEFVSLQRGHDLTEPERKPGTVPVMGSAGQNGFHDTALAKGPGIVIGRSGASFGQVHYCPVDYWPHNTTLYVTDFHGNDPQFAYYFLKSINFARYNSGSAQPSLNRNFIYPIEVNVPQFDDQRAIAHILGTLDDKIELNRRMNETLEAMARALFKDWFVDFDPVRAKVEDRWQRGQSLPGLPAHLYDLFPDSFEDSELGEIPTGWGVRPVGHFAELKGGKQLEKERITSDGSIPVFGGAGIMGFTDDHNADGFVISVGRVGAYCGQFFSCRGRAWINNNASLIRQFDGVSAEWLFQALRHADIEVIKKGAAQPFVSNTDIAAMSIIWPGEIIVSKFAEVLVPLMLKAEQNQSESANLVRSRDTLLPKLISGEIRIKDVEHFIEDAL